MQPSNPSPGGILLVIAIVAGTGIGLAFGQPSIGFLAGIGVGIAAAVFFWRRDRLR